ncbi:hypothetical protein [Alteriqipengyuania lutimaris]|uniref:Uncharacterized protein n=1 Tax=Alteriqipengyuania lutimaris TaxID=1538146 RepID=A0A395LHU2_9SPHN|nr:hypothetical protein [Alteriqipengyuania lutimaris]MBB3034676.1 hypothetical protein [Alteriqipengyuania lutimaris]RDS76463.1 hypothetical protein DL238_01790 [Alteriqipengyuania lutimaris]
MTVSEIPVPFMSPPLEVSTTEVFLPPAGVFAKTTKVFDAPPALPSLARKKLDIQVAFLGLKLWYFNMLPMHDVLAPLLPPLFQPPFRRNY